MEELNFFKWMGNIWLVTWSCTSVLIWTYISVAGDQISQLCEGLEYHFGPKKFRKSTWTEDVSFQSLDIRYYLDIIKKG